MCHLFWGGPRRRAGWFVLPKSNLQNFQWHYMKWSDCGLKWIHRWKTWCLPLCEFCSCFFMGYPRFCCFPYYTAGRRRARNYLHLYQNVVWFQTSGKGAGQFLKCFNYSHPPWREFMGLISNETNQCLGIGDWIIFFRSLHKMNLKWHQKNIFHSLQGS